MRHYFLFLSVILITLTSCGQKSQKEKTTYTVTMSDKEWQEKLSPEQYRVLRQSGTERPFTGQYWDNKKAGRYSCSGCDQQLFLADTKFKSGTGWPSFYNFIENIIEIIIKCIFSKFWPIIIKFIHFTFINIFHFFLS